MMKKASLASPSFTIVAPRGELGGDGGAEDRSELASRQPIEEWCGAKGAHLVGEGPPNPHPARNDDQYEQDRGDHPGGHRADAKEEQQHRGMCRQTDHGGSPTQRRAGASGSSP